MTEIKALKLTGFNKMIGLINAKNPMPVLLNTRFGIHTFGMTYPIDVLILNDSDHIVKLRSSLHPNGIFLWNPLYNKVLELPAGYIEKFKFKLDEKIHISYINS